MISFISFDYKIKLYEDRVHYIRLYFFLLPSDHSYLVYFEGLYRNLLLLKEYIIAGLF